MLVGMGSTSGVVGRSRLCLTCPGQLNCYTWAVAHLENRVGGHASVTSLDHCIDTLSDYGPGRESCKDKAFCQAVRVTGSFPGSFSEWQCRSESPGDTTLSEARHSKTSLQGWHVVIQLVYNWSTIGLPQAFWLALPSMFLNSSVRPLF